MPAGTFKQVCQLSHPLTSCTCTLLPACIPVAAWVCGGVNAACLHDFCPVLVSCCCVISCTAGDVDAPIVVPLVAAVVVTVAVTFAVPAYLNRGECKVQGDKLTGGDRAHASALS